jgi:hypothetical protein
MNNLLLIDTNGLAHFFVHKVEKNEIALDNLSRYVELNVMYLLSGAPLYYVAGDIPLNVLFLMDTKPYWRDISLKQIGINYKGKRQCKPEKLSLLSSILTTIQRTLLYRFKHPLFSLIASRRLEGHTVGYEADDLAASVVKMKHKTHNHIYLLTDDNDWLPLTSFQNVTWLGIANRQPRMRTHTQALQWCRTCFEAKRSIERSKFVFNSPLDLWEFKAYFGDTSDNIPGDKKHKSEGLFKQYIDLLNPNSNFMAWTERDFNIGFELAKGKERLPISPEKAGEMLGSFPFVIPPFNQNDYLFFDEVKPQFKGITEMQARASIGV